MNKEGIYEASLTVKESIKTPNKIETIADLKGEFLSENGNKKMTGQHGDIPFSFNQSGDEIMKNGRKNEVKKINIFLFFLTIIF